MEQESDNVVVPCDWPEHWEKEYIHHHVSLADRILNAQAEKNPPRVRFCLICPFASFASYAKYASLPYMPHLPHMPHMSRMPHCLMCLICLTCLTCLAYLTCLTASCASFASHASHASYASLPSYALIIHLFLSQLSQLILYQSQIKQLFGHMSFKDFKKKFLECNDTLLFYRHYR